MIGQAAQLAMDRHSDQERKFTKDPYIIHPIRVANIVKRYKDSHKATELITAAILHDTLEDTNTTEKELKEDFGELVLSLVKEVTTDKNEKEKLGKQEYLAQKMIRMSSWALVIKLADRLDNLSDFKIATKDWKEKYKKETNYILRKLEKERKLSQTQKNLIKDIKERLI